MNTIVSSSRGFGLLCRINFDRLLFPAAIGVSLWIGAVILSL